MPNGPRTGSAEQQWFAAAFHLGRLLQRSPKDVELHCRRARAYLELQWWSRAADQYRRGDPPATASREAWLMRGLLEYRQGHLAKAHADLAHAAMLAPDDPAVAAWQAFLNVVDSQPEKAAGAEKRMLQRLTILRPGGPEWFGSKPDPSPAWALLEHGLTQRLEKEPKAVRLLRLRGMVRAARGNSWVDAYNDFREAVRLRRRTSSRGRELLAESVVGNSTACGWRNFTTPVSRSSAWNPKPASSGICAASSSP